MKLAQQCCNVVKLRSFKDKSSGCILKVVLSDLCFIQHSYIFKAKIFQCFMNLPKGKEICNQYDNNVIPFTADSAKSKIDKINVPKNHDKLNKILKN